MTNPDHSASNATEDALFAAWTFNAGLPPSVQSALRHTVAADLTSGTSLVAEALISAASAPNPKALINSHGEVEHVAMHFYRWAALANAEACLQGDGRSRDQIVENPPPVSPQFLIAPLAFEWSPSSTSCSFVNRLVHRRDQKTT